MIKIYKVAEHCFSIEAGEDFPLWPKMEECYGPFEVYNSDSGNRFTLIVDDYTENRDEMQLVYSNMENVKDGFMAFSIFDYYALKAQDDIDHNYYKNLDLVREKTLGNKMPFWVITQAGPINTGTIDPNETTQRWSVWSNIALGSKGISYFTYWTPVPEANLGPVGFMVLRDGTKRDIYYWIKQINADIKTIGKKLLPCHADGAIIGYNVGNYPLFVNNSSGRTKYGPVTQVTPVSSTYQVLCGCFRDARTAMNGDNYKGYKVLVTAQRPDRDVAARLKLESSITSITVTQNNSTQVVELNNLTNFTFAGEQNTITLTYSDGTLTVNIPKGEAALIEF